MRIRLLAACAVWAIVSIAFGKDPEPSAEEAAIRAGARAYVAAFNKQDAAALAAMFAENGEQIDGDGTVTRCREAIQKRFVAGFAARRGGKMQVKVESVRLAAANVALEHGSYVVRSADGDEAKGAYSAVHVKQKDGKWLIESLRDTPAPPPPSREEKLAELAWLVGEWVDASDGASVHTVCKWAANKSFLTRTFTVYIEYRLDVQGTQVIGWDAAAGKIRSWSFDSHGGFSEGTWARKDNYWTIRNAGVSPEGRKTSAINTLTRLDDDRFSFKSTSREIDGEPQPDIEAVEVVRASAE